MITEPINGIDNKSVAQTQGAPVSGTLLTDTKVLGHRNVGEAVIGLENLRVPPNFQ